MQIHWGIAGTGKICNDFVVALKTLDPTKHVIEAIAARSKNSAEKFSKLFSISEAYEGYSHLATHKSINAVYVGVINTEHFAISKIMMEQGKHVLCEKPLCMNAKETRELIEIAKKNKVLLMEALWSRCFPSYKEIRKQLDSNAIGEVVQVSVNFGFPLENIDRVMSKKLGGGVMHDLGVYVLQFAQFVFPGLKPIEIKALGEIGGDGVDISAGILIKFSKNKLASLSVNSRAIMSNTAEIMGSEGFIKVPNFWCPIEIITPTETKEFPLPETNLELNFFNSTGLCYEAEEMRVSIEKGLLECSSITHEESITLSEWRDNILAQIGIA